VIHKCPQLGRQVPAFGVVEKKARQRRAERLQQRHEFTALDVLA
jgi:hypothetical protein